MHEQTPSWWLEKVHDVLHKQLEELKKLASSERSTVINITDNLFIGGQMPKLDLTRLTTALAKNTSVGDVLDSIFDAVVEAIKGATSQSELDALVEKLESDNFREDARVEALKGLVTPATPVFSATWNGPTSATMGDSFAGAAVASGGTPPYTFQLVSGAFPDGVNLTPDGTASGTIAAAGVFSFSGSVVDSVGAVANWTGEISVDGAI